MNDWINKISTLFDDCSKRAQIMFTLAAAIVIFLVWLFVLVLPLSRTIQSTAKKMETTQKNLLKLITLHDHYQSIIYSPTDTAEKKIELLEAQLTKLEHHPLLNKKIIGSSEDFKNVLQAISKTSSTISLNQVQKLSFDPIAAPIKISLMNQKIMIEFTGNYFETIHYLHYLEALPWYLSFDSMEYQVETYPNAKVKLVIGVLSTAQGASH